LISVNYEDGGAGFRLREKAQAGAGAADDRNTGRRVPPARADA